MERIAENSYGYVDPGAREYVITRPDTPTPWMNYLGQGRYGGIISNTAVATPSTATRATGG